MLKLPLTRDMLYTPVNNIKVLCLIKELCKHTDEPVFTIRDEKEGYESLKTLFVNLTVEDPTEAEFAEVVFGDVGYWLKARENKILKPHLEDWRHEANIKRKALAFKSIINEVKTEGKSAFSAAKFLIEEPYKDKRNPKTKAQTQEATKKAYEQAAKEQGFPSLDKFVQ